MRDSISALRTVSLWSSATARSCDTPQHAGWPALPADGQGVVDVSVPTHPPTSALPVLSPAPPEHYCHKDTTESTSGSLGYHLTSPLFLFTSVLLPESKNSFVDCVRRKTYKYVCTPAARKRSLSGDQLFSLRGGAHLFEASLSHIFQRSLSVLSRISLRQHQRQRHLVDGVDVGQWSDLGD
jgi:hypothetical protein